MGDGAGPTMRRQGIPHGPHPGTVEKSLGKEWTTELAVMCDTFRPLFPTKAALELDDAAYPESWKGEHFPRTGGTHAPNGEAEPAVPTPEREPAAVDTSG